MTDTPPSVSLGQLENLTYGKDFGTGEGGVLARQERMTDSEASNIDTNAKADAPNASGTSDGSNNDTPKIDVKIGIGNMCTIAITLYRRMSLSQKALRDTQ